MAVTTVPSETYVSLRRSDMAYICHSDEDRQRLLDAMGLHDIQELFAPIPAPLRSSRLDLPGSLSEIEVRRRLEALAAADRPAHSASFLGAGCYRHFIPAAVRALVSRSEFATVYTPYQAEVSQGTLQHIFEFQTAMCELTGLDVVNASLYDGPSALAEAAFMALRLTKRDEIVVSAGVHPEAVEVLATYAAGPDISIRVLPIDPVTGRTIIGDPPEDARHERTRMPHTADHRGSAGVILVQQPNFLGVVEDLAALASAAHAGEALLVVMQNPMTLGVLPAPGHLGADIAVGDAQVFGNPMCFGGPSAGFLACRKAYLRQIPGRLVGQTTDADDRTCYTLTLQVREQHIRRAKATSNICSNQALNALAATVYLSLLGPQGLKELGELCVRRAHYLHSRLCSLPGVKPTVQGPFFHEFAVNLPMNDLDFRLAMRALGVDPGVPLSRFGRPGSLLVAVTELNPPEALDQYVTAADEVLAHSRKVGRGTVTGGGGRPVPGGDDTAFGAGGQKGA
jgi:glycine dehydrogenase subunit 1